MSAAELTYHLGDNCVIVALGMISGRRRKEVIDLIDDMGCSRQGATPVEIAMLLDRLGYNWSVQGTMEARTKTPREVSNEKWVGSWLIFTRDHVMPLINGRVTNFNGCGDEPITFVMNIFRTNNESG